MRETMIPHWSDPIPYPMTALSAMAAHNMPDILSLARQYTTARGYGLAQRSPCFRGIAMMTAAGRHPGGPCDIERLCQSRQLPQILAAVGAEQRKQHRMCVLGGAALAAGKRDVRLHGVVNAHRFSTLLADAHGGRELVVHQPGPEVGLRTVVAVHRFVLPCRCSAN